MALSMVGLIQLRQQRAEMTPAERRAQNRRGREFREEYRNNASPEMRRLLDRSTVDRITLGATGGCESQDTSAVKRVGRAAIAALNPMQHVGMLSRGVSSLANELGASPDTVDMLDAPARLQTQNNVAARRGVTRAVGAVRDFADRVF